jgi:hypothetical protein
MLLSAAPLTAAVILYGSSLAAMIALKLELPRGHEELFQKNRRGTLTDDGQCKIPFPQATGVKVAPPAAGQAAATGRRFKSLSRIEIAYSIHLSSRHLLQAAGAMLSRNRTCSRSRLCLLVSREHAVASEGMPPNDPMD